MIISRLKELFKNGKYWIQLLLLCYHSIFVIIAYYYALNNGGDANLYWFQIENEIINNKSWYELLNYGTEFILFLNYHFAILLELPQYIGFIMYGSIGFLGILQFKKLTELWIGKSIYIFKINFLPILYFLPNLHFWTANLGKEPICFLCISTIFLQLKRREYGSWQFFSAIFFLVLIRPHVALMLIFSIGLIYSISKNIKLKQRIALGAATALFTLVCFYLFLQLSKVKYFDWGRLKYFNDYSILSFKNSGSYVPMLEYNYVEKLFALFFRPIFYDASTAYSWILSTENALILLIHIIAIFLIIKFRARVKIDSLFKIIIIYTFISGLLYVQRYAGLGIFVRTKIMIQPFTIIAIVYIIKSTLDKSSDNRISRKVNY